MSLIKTADQILRGRPRPVDEPIRRRGHNAGRKPMYPDLCMHCHVEPHHCRGLGRTCYQKWRRKKTGPIQPFEPVTPPRGVVPCLRASEGCMGITGPRSARGWCETCYQKWRLHGDPAWHAPTVSLCRSKNCKHEELKEVK